MKNLIDGLRNMADHKKEYLKEEKYSLEFRNQKRDEIKVLQDSADLLERIYFLSNQVKDLFNI